MNYPYLICAIFIMAGVTYLVRMLPIVIFRKEIRSPFVKSFLYYVPYAVLAAMTIPEILYSTGSIWSAVVGLICAFILAYNKRSLLTVALGAVGAVFVAELIFGYFGVM